MSSLDVASARHLIANNPDTLVVDVRTPAEFGTAHIPEAVNLPLDQVDTHLRRIVDDAGGRVILVCQGGSRAERCQRVLAAAGLADTTVLDGGMNAWAAAGAPIARGVPRWSLERQVRLAAGSIVLLAVVVSLWWLPARFLAGVIGAGLALAAVTDTCVLGMLLTKLPYNRRGGTDIEHSLARLSRQG
ncbi:MAG TPA: rhodanese-like domain-containing protein [Amycolatopsis sp.]|uniref:Rhodanese-like domain-containing protein n=1 Tax=Amycolatopsis nalaikhensis TaxID=715472 RepID=A0ABY8XE05_9PSEU|nr:rhodanese-like domain-containing protein [Amycolatopsis sp. 2-2]WIV53848.1 rhodanese-like domain-containing protein [Amycolatopsis sp. 2-2]HWD02716.1 rhodanese-like domain-containing protein [Amycolatopsis sp.]